MSIFMAGVMSAAASFKEGLKNKNQHNLRYLREKQKH